MEPRHIHTKPIWRHRQPAHKRTCNIGHTLRQHAGSNNSTHQRNTVARNTNTCHKRQHCSGTHQQHTHRWNHHTRNRNHHTRNRNHHTRNRNHSPHSRHHYSHISRSARRDTLVGCSYHHQPHSCNQHHNHQPHSCNQQYHNANNNQQHRYNSLVSHYDNHHTLSFLVSRQLQQFIRHIEQCR